MTVAAVAMVSVIDVLHNLVHPALAVFNVMSNKSEVLLHSFAVTCFVVLVSVSWQGVTLCCQNGMVVRYRRRRRQQKVHLINYLSFSVIFHRKVKECHFKDYIVMIIYI